MNTELVTCCGCSPSRAGAPRHSPEAGDQSSGCTSDRGRHGVLGVLHAVPANQTQKSSVMKVE
jgi:hypothetical protein